MKWYYVFIIVFLVAVVLAIIIPNLLEPVTQPGRASAIALLRTISSAQELYNTKYGRYGIFEELEKAGMIDGVQAHATNPSSTKSGYYFLLRLNAEADEWSCIARPAEWGITGRRNFKIDQEGIIYFNEEENSSDWSRELGG